MGAANKFFFFLIACLAFEAIHAWPHFNIFRWKNLGYEINKAADDADRDVRKDLLNTKNKIWKESSKVIKKTQGAEAVVMCMMYAQEDHLKKVDLSSVEAMKCIEDVRSEVNLINDKDYELPELNAMKNNYKRQVKECRNKSKQDFKGNEKSFSQMARTCMVDPSQRPSETEDDSEREFF